MSSCLVTGGAGFLGSHVCFELLKHGYDVVALDDLSGGFPENIPSGATFVQGSINDVDLVNKLFHDRRFEYVFHLAAYAAEGLSHFIKRFNYTNNLIGSVNLINAAVNSATVNCFIFTSSIAVYGRNQLPMTEEMTPAPEDPYGIAKYAVELDLKQAHEIFGLNYIVFRPHNVYGENQNIGDPYRNVIGIFMNQILQRQPLTLFGDGKQTRAFSYISDVAPIIAEAIHRKDSYNDIFNVGADTPHTILELAETVSLEMGVQPELRFLEPRNEVVHAFSSHEKARQVFGDLMKNVPLRTGISRMAAWVKQSGPRQGKPFGEIEVRKHLPSFWATFTQS